MTADPAGLVRRVVALFDELAASYDDALFRFYPFAADRLILRLGPGPGDRLLDVATGTGHVAMAAAQAIGPTGRVTAIDLSAPMLSRFEAKISQFGIANIDLHEMHAQVLEFRRDYFHHVVCSHGLYYLPDMVMALAQWVRVLRPGGRLAFTAFGPGAFSPLLDSLLADLAKQGVALNGDEVALLYRRVNRPEDCRALLAGAGLTDISVETVQLGFHLKNALEWWEFVEKGPLHTLLAPLTPAARTVVRDAQMEAVSALAGENGIWLDVETLFASGQRPDVAKAA